MGFTEKLVKEILDFDEDHPGLPEAEVVIDFETWQNWVDMAGEISAMFSPEGETAA